MNNGQNDGREFLSHDLWLADERRKVSSDNPYLTRDWRQMLIDEVSCHIKAIRKMSEKFYNLPGPDLNGNERFAIAMCTQFTPDEMREYSNLLQSFADFVDSRMPDIASGDCII